MYVIRLPNGNLLVPESVIADGGTIISDAYVEIGPDDADYARLAEQALTQEEFDARRRRWQEGDESLRRQFLDFLARRGQPSAGGNGGGGDSAGEGNSAGGSRGG
jgi:hypothetical protein